jgi:hypothetical protein
VVGDGQHARRPAGGWWPGWPAGWMAGGPTAWWVSSPEDWRVGCGAVDSGGIGVLSVHFGMENPSTG